MRDAAGYTLVELLVASAIMLGTMTAVFAVLNDGMVRSPLWNEAADLHQRARVAVDAIGMEVKASGAGLIGVTTVDVPPIEPRRRTATGASPSDLTVRYVPDGGASATLAEPLVPGTVPVPLEIASSCPDGTVACGFTAGMDAVVFDGTGRWDSVLIESIAPGSITVSDRLTVRTSTYDTGSVISQIAESTFYFDPRARMLRREGAGGGDLPLVDNVVDVRFEYFDAGLASLPIVSFADGPFCGTGATAYDCDVLRIRRVRAVLRLQTGAESLRGRDTRLFLWPGTASSPGRTLPDITIAGEMTPPNLQR